MSFRPFQKVRLVTEEDLTTKSLNLLQDNIASALGQLLGKDVLDLSIVKNVVLTAGIVNKVAHNLGRQLTGYMIVRCHGGYPLVYEVQDTNPSQHLLLYLMSATTIKVDLLVF